MTELADNKRDRRSAVIGQPVSIETIRVLHQAHIDGLRWAVIAEHCGVHVQTLQAALLQRGVSSRVREKLELFVKAYQQTRAK